MARVVTQAAFTLSGTLAQGLVRISIPILIGQFTNPAAVAQVSLVLSVSILLSMVWPTPAGTAASRFTPTTAPDRPGALRTLRSTTLVAVVILSGAAVAIVFVNSDSVELAVLGGFVTGTYSAYFFTRGVFLGRFRARALSVWEIAGALVAVGGTLASLMAGYAVGALWALSLGYLLIALAGWPWRAGPRAPMESVVLRFTIHNALASAFSNGLVQLAIVIVVAIVEPTTAGYFAAAFALATPASLIGQAMNQVLIPALATSHATATATPERRALSIAALKLIGLTAIPFGLVFALAPAVLPVLFGIEYAPASGILQILTIAMYFFTIALYPAAALTAWGRLTELVWVNVIALVVGVGAMVALTLEWGTTGAAVGLGVGTVVMFVATAVVAARSMRPLA